MAEKNELDDLLGQKHFGLAGMMERAELMDADVRIDSTPGDGTRIKIIWRNKQWNDSAGAPLIP